MKFEKIFGEQASSLVIGIGTGKTVTSIIENYFSEDFVKKHKFVPSSLDSETLLKKFDATVLSLFSAEALDIYVDSADFVLPSKKWAIKGYGGALFKEKICYLKAKKAILVVDSKKVVDKFDNLQIPVEVHPLALGLVTRYLNSRNLPFSVRQTSAGKHGYAITENCNLIVDVKMETFDTSSVMEIQQLVGVICTGFFYEQETRIYVFDKDEVYE
ncbi:MAG: ribose 5-phosphate isomerase A [Deltaproteobacteria bacterium]|nr:ribose 5-phosphate isomerase A [Deltaproteobacteria bacterium]MCX7952214.1 ribose 5-phosphate isomerase A [Deltaproteobacteria bacterium]